MTKEELQQELDEVRAVFRKKEATYELALETLRLQVRDLAEQNRLLRQAASK